MHSPHDLLLLLESFVQQVDLQRKRVFLHVAVEVLQVDVVGHRLVIHGEVHLLGQSFSQGRFACEISIAILGK